ncbi:hypothetical protein AAVH_26470 [Aphelenchoides avenae]|nr:hypothetical protein AAVH_26470 [Aphelenchus avenae]
MLVGMSLSALRVVLSLESLWVRFLDVLLVYQTVLFALLIDLIIFKSGHMPYYRWCLLVNVTSIYIVVVGCFLGKPFVLAEGYFFVPLGIVSKLGPRVHFYCVLIILFPICCHGLALIFCICYQAMQVPSWHGRLA